MLRVVADTNIYISALNFGGPPAHLLRLANAGDIRLLMSGAILAETVLVLRRARFAWPESRIAQTLHDLGSMVERVEPTRQLDLIPADPTDNRILECADAGRADYIVSGDKHLLHLKQHRRAPIIKVTEFLRQLTEQASPDPIA